MASRPFNARHILESLSSTQTDVTRVLAALSELSSLENANAVPREILVRLSQILFERADHRLILTSCLVAVAHLASFQRTRILFADVPDLVPNVIEKLSSYSQGMKRSALEALANLSEFNRHQARIITHKETVTSGRALMTLVSVMQRDVEELQKFSARILHNIAQDEHSVYGLVSDDEVIEALIVTLENTQYGNTDSMFATAEITKLMVTLTKAANGDLCRHICELGAIEPLVNLIREEQKSEEVRHSAMQALFNIASMSDRFRKWIGEHDGVQVLVSYLDSVMNAISSKKRALEDGDLTEEEKQALLERKILACRLLSYITEEMTDDHRSKDYLYDNKQALIACGGLRTLLQMIGRQESSDLVEICVKIIGNVSVQDNTVRILEGGVIDTLLDMLVETAQSNDRTSRNKREYVIRAVASFAYYGQSVQKLVELGVINRLLKMIEDDVEVVSVCEMFAQMNQHPSFQKVIYQTRGLTTIVDLLKNSDNDNYKLASLRALEPFTQSSNGRLVLKKTGVTDELKSYVENFERELEEEEEEAELRRLRELQERRNKSRAAQLAEKYHTADPEEEKAKEEERRREMEKRQQERLSKSEVYTYAKHVLRRIQKEHDPVSRLGLEKAEPFTFDYDELERIDRELVSECEKRINETVSPHTFVLNRAGAGARATRKKGSLRVEINWRMTERIDEDADREHFVALLAREAVWDELAEAVETFVSGNENCIHALSSQVKVIIVGIDGFDTDSTRREISSIKDMAQDVLSPEIAEQLDTSEADLRNMLLDKSDTLYLDELTLYYNISKDGYLQNPRLLAGKLSTLLLGYDITLFEDADEVDEDYQIEIDNLKKVCSDSRLAMIGDINILYFHLEMAYDLWKNSFADVQAITASAQQLFSRDELLIKGWRVVKYNKNGLKQERLLLLSNTSYYTVCFDYANKRIDFDHCKHHPLEEVYLFDIGLIVPRTARRRQSGSGKESDGKRGSGRMQDSDTLTATEELEIALSQMVNAGTDMQLDDDDDRVRFGLNLVTREAPHRQGILFRKRKKKPISYVDKETVLLVPDSSTSVSLSMGSDDEDNMSDDLDTVTERNLKEEQELMGGDSAEREDEVEAVRPNTDGMYNSVFIAPNSVPVHMQKNYLEEIAWCMYAAATAAQRAHVYKPFYTRIEKPEGSIAAKVSKIVYNKMRLGFMTESNKRKSMPKLSTSEETQKQQDQKQPDLMRRKSARLSFRK